MNASLESLLDMTKGICQYSLTDLDSARAKLEHEIKINPTREIRISVIGTNNVNKPSLVSSMLTFRLKQFVDNSNVIICHSNINRCDTIISKYCKLSNRKPCRILVDDTIPEWQRTSHPYDIARKKLIDISDIVIFIDNGDGEKLRKWITHAKDVGCLICKRTIK